MSASSVVARIAVVLISFTAVAQTWRGAIHGTVLDASDARVANASVTITSSESGKARTATSDSAGTFTVSLLPPGSYTVRVERDGFRLSSVEIPLQVNQEVRIEVKLQAGN